VVNVEDSAIGMNALFPTFWQSSECFFLKSLVSWSPKKNEIKVFRILSGSTILRHLLTDFAIDEEVSMVCLI
jgi:hypothetical protein